MASATKRDPVKSLDALTTKCIRCGFCLESCPTFLETGQETESPRGRIYLVRSAEEGKVAWEAARGPLSRCLGCLACETACPSGVDYSEIVEIARDRLEQIRPNQTQAALLKATTHPKLLRTQLGLGRLLPGKRIPALLSRLLSGELPEVDRPQPQAPASWPALDENTLPPIRGEVYLLEGCAMRVLFPRVHQATRRLLRRIGYMVRETNAGCCGALHTHNGYLDEARRLAGRLMEAMPGDLPVIVNSAGCGSTMKEYGSLLENEATSLAARPPFQPCPAGGEVSVSEKRIRVGVEPSDEVASDGETFERRVVDVSEFLLAHGLIEALRKSPGLSITATYHDACHLAHGQLIKNEPRELLQGIPGIKLVPLAEADTCCGSAGIYNLTQPKMARQLLERKWKNVEQTGAEVVVLGNPGCHAWIAQAAREHGSSMRVLHTTELLEAAFTGIQALRP